MQKRILPVHFLFLLLLAYTVPVAAQIKWFKYDGNPVLDPGSPGSWDAGSVYVTSVIRNGAAYHLWYQGLDLPESITRMPWRIGCAVSSDGITWRKHPRPVLEEGPPGSWDSGGVVHCGVLFYGSKYHMWYSGIVAFPEIRIGYAWSFDGILWTKRPFPVLTPDGSGSWDSVGVCLPSVLPSADGIRIWYSGWGNTTLSDCGIGYATARDETTWVRSHQTPFRFQGHLSRWDTTNTGLQRIIFDGQRYQMWFFVGPPDVKLGQSAICRAVSLDGINWLTSPADEPVLLPGRDGSWDDVGIRPGGILFDGDCYHMWYTGFNGSVWRTGYAVSPLGLDVSIQGLRQYSSHGGDNIFITVRTPQRHSASFTAQFRTPDTGSPQTVELYDDGLHMDSVAGDGVYGARWLPMEDHVYFMDLRLRMRGKDKPLGFTMLDAARFATIRHVNIDSLEFVRDREPNPGDTLLLGLHLSHGGIANIPDVTASLIPVDSFAISQCTSALSVGDMAAGTLVRPLGYCRVVVREDCPPGSTVKLKATLLSAGVPFLDQVLTFQVRLPWWRTTWALVISIALLASLIVAGIRTVERNKLRTRILVLEREKAMEQERARISQDMHDEVGSSLSEIAILSELAKKKPDQVGVRVDEISQRTAELIDNVSEIVWATNPKNDTLENLLGYIRRYAVKYLDLAGIACEFQTAEMVPAIPVLSDIRRNLFLVVKEALHNVVKHSGASAVCIEVNLHGELFEMSIKDNGRGFVIENQRDTGNGLASMCKRMADIGGTCTIQSTPDNGTEILLKAVPQKSR